MQTIELDADRRELRVDGEPVAIPPKAFSVLAYLIDHRDRMVSKRELLDAFWAASVSETALLKAISLIRKAVSGVGEVIKTYHGQGYRFVAEVDIPAPDSVRQTSDSGVPVLAEQRLAAVLSVRFAADPSDALDGCLSAAREIVEAHQGHLLHMMLDGFTATFGLNLHYEDVARRAVCCASALANSVATSAGCGMRFGVETGPLAVAGDVEQWAPPHHMERGATALARVAGPGQIYLSGATRRQLSDEVDVAPVEGSFRLISAPSPRAGIPGRPHKRPSSFVGRIAELAFLNTHLSMLCSGAGRALMLMGPAGIGKTRLVAEFLASLPGKAVRVVTLNCLPGLSNTPLAPITEMLRVLRPDLSAQADEVDAALWRELRGESPRSEPALQGLSDQERRRRRDLLVDRALYAAAGRGPLLLVFEDVHWLDATSREYLERLIRDVDQMRLMVLLTSRPSASPLLVEPLLKLSPLGRNESLALLRDHPDSMDMADAAADTLVRRAGGNPFFLEELALAARAGANPARDLPETVHAVIAVRIGALAADLRMLVYVLAVIGPPAPLLLAAHLLGRDATAVKADLVRLARSGFIVDDPGGVTFRHMLIQDSAYSMLAPGDRRRLHSRIAGYLEQHPADALARPETLAWHYQEGGDTEQAVNAWTVAARAALTGSAHKEAVAFANHGLALIHAELPDCERRELALQLCLAPALTALRGFAAHDAGAAYYRAQTLGRSVGNPKTRVRVLVGLWIHTWVRGRLHESLAHARELMGMAEAAQDPALSLQAHASIGQVLMHMGRLDEAQQHLTTGMGFVDREPPATAPAQSAAVACAAYASWVASLLGRSEDARHFLAISRRLSRMLPNPFAVAIHYALCSEHFMLEGDVAGCLDYADQAVAISREHDFAFWLGTGLAMRGWALGRQGRFDAAADALDEGIAVFEATDAGVQLANWYGLRAELQLAAGRIEQGLATAEHALACAERADDLYFVPRIHAVIAGLHEQQGHADRARRHAEQAGLMAARFGMSPRAIALDTPTS